MEARERKDMIALEDGGYLVQKGTLADVSEAKGEIVAMVSTPSVDSYGDIIHQGPSEKGKGWLLDRFNNAPVMLWSHNIFQMNISGPETRAAVRQHPVHGEALFLEPVRFDGGDPDAMALEGKIRRRVIKENSVGFVSKKSEFIRDGETDRVTGIRFFEQELLELSWANRGANPDTATMFKSMLSMHPDIASRVLTTDDAAAEMAKADLLGTIEQLADRVRTLEGLAVSQSKLIEQLTDTRQAVAVITAKSEQAAALDVLLSKLGKV